jgi:hypothetical protein
MNTGEELVSSYLRYILGCEFIQKNLYTVDTQGEIDVVGINLEKGIVYICEVAIHLITGLQYTKGTAPNNVQKLTDKLSRDIEYAQNHLKDYQIHVMLWSPIVKNGKPDSKYSQTRDIDEIRNNILAKYDIEVEFVINEKFLASINEMRELARKESSEFKCPVMRFMQIEERLKNHVSKNQRS